MDFNSISFCSVYTANGQTFHTDKLQNGHFDISVETDGDCLYAKITPKTAVAFAKLCFELPYHYEKDSRIFVNGYQSWTDSFEYSVDESMRELSRLTEFCITKTPIKAIGLPKSGDTLFHKFPRKNGFFYGWSYGYVRNGVSVTVFGSLDERSGFTCVSFDVNNSAVLIEKDLEGVVFEEEP